MCPFACFPSVFALAGVYMTSGAFLPGEPPSNPAKARGQSGSPTPGDRVADISPGHHQRMSLSPVSAISDMVAPVVLITMGVIFSNALMNFTTAFADRVLAMDRERLGILRGPHVEMLDEDSVPPNDRERVRQISDVTPRLVKRIEQSRAAIIIVWVAIGLLVLSVAA